MITTDRQPLMAVGWQHFIKISYSSKLESEIISKKKTIRLQSKFDKTKRFLKIVIFLVKVFYNNNMLLLICVFKIT